MEFKAVYFLGIGGIGMSALAKYFIHNNYRVGGYDRTSSELTVSLEKAGAWIHYEDSVEEIPSEFMNPSECIIVYTPAIPKDHTEFNYFLSNGFTVEKRSQMLGHLSQGKFVMAVAGTHGKTTTSTLIAWLNHSVLEEGSAFLGGISKNFMSNLVLGTGKRLAVEADEFDRSFLRLFPNCAVVTSADADHLDIYGTHEKVKEAFSDFISQIKPDGALIIKLGVDVKITNSEIEVFRYSYDTPCDFYASDITLLEGGYYSYTINTPYGAIRNCTLGIPGWVNIENSVAATACFIAANKSTFGYTINEDIMDRLRRALREFSGVKRRFEFYVNNPKHVYMDDYAHHPEELHATITSVKKMFPGRRVLAIFQPHLYTRTRDLYIDFARSLSEADEVILLPIYPARELPIDGIESGIIMDRITKPCRITSREELPAIIDSMQTDVVISFGAGNIDACCEAIADVLKNKK